MPLVGPKIGFGPRWLQPFLSKIQKCSERSVDGCVPGATEGCCTVIPCKLCLMWDVYGDEPIYGVAEWEPAIGQWVGTVGPIDFIAYWRQDASSNGCEFVVFVNAVVAAEFEKCAGYGVTCRDPSNETEVTVGYDTGTLSWSKIEPKPLPYTTEDGCVVHFCGDCECTCTTLCATVTSDDCFGSGELGDDSYQGLCPTAPEWSGDVECGEETYSISLSLARDEYTGGCLLGGTLTAYSSGTETTLEDFVITDCTSLSASWEMYDGTVIEVHCKVCDCTVPEEGCVGCCWPIEQGDLQDIPWEISAPNCPELDGKSGVFVPHTRSGGLSDNGACGPCMCFNPTNAPINLNGSFWQDLGGICTLQSCGANFCFALTCDAGEQAVGGIAGCCSRMRLVVWALNQRIQTSEDAGAEDPEETSPFDCSDADPGGCPFDPESAAQLRPAACACEPALSAVFDLSGIEFFCSDPDIVGGPCDGKTSCCLIQCNFAGATLTI